MTLSSRALTRIWSRTRPRGFAPCSVCCIGSASAQNSSCPPIRSATQERDDLFSWPPVICWRAITRRRRLIAFPDYLAWPKGGDGPSVMLESYADVISPDGPSGDGAGRAQAIHRICSTCSIPLYRQSLGLGKPAERQRSCVRAGLLPAQQDDRQNNSMSTRRRGARRRRCPCGRKGGSGSHRLGRCWRPGRSCCRCLGWRSSHCSRGRARWRRAVCSRRGSGRAGAVKGNGVRSTTSHCFNEEPVGAGRCARMHEGTATICQTCRPSVGVGQNAIHPFPGDCRYNRPVSYRGEGVGMVWAWPVLIRQRPTSISVLVVACASKIPVVGLPASSIEYCRSTCRCPSLGGSWRVHRARRPLYPGIGSGRKVGGVVTDGAPTAVNPGARVEDLLLPWLKKLPVRHSNAR